MRRWGRRRTTTSRGARGLFDASRRVVGYLLERFSEAPWGVLGASLRSQGFLGASWVSLGGPLGTLGGRLGASSGPLGGILGVSRGLLGASSGHLGALVGALSRLPGIILGPSWRPLGPTAVEHLKRTFQMLHRGEAPGASWGPQDMSWAPPALSGPPGAVLGPSGRPLGFPAVEHLTRPFQMLYGEGGGALWDFQGLS